MSLKSWMRSMGFFFLALWLFMVVWDPPVILAAGPGWPPSVHIDYANLGSSGTNVHLAATLDPSLSYMSDTPGMSPTAQGGTATWQLDNLPLFASGSFTLTLATENAAPGEDAPVQLEIRANEGDANPDDNQAATTIHIAKPLATGIHVLDVASHPPNSLDPAETWYPEIVDQLFAGLTRIDSESLEPIPDLAVSWQMSSDAKTFTFTLRDGLTWSDGTPLTASDVRYAILRTLDPDGNAYYASILFLIKHAEGYHNGSITDPDQVGVTVLDDHRVRFELIESASYFPSILSLTFTRPVPEHVIEAWGEDWTAPEHIVTSGPYLLDEFAPDRYLVMKKNPSYHKADETEIMYVNVHLVDDMDQAWEMYQTGVLDTAPIYGEHLATTLSDPLLSQELHTQLSGATFYLGFNLAKSPFNNPYVRKAFAAAIDRQGVIRAKSSDIRKPTLTFTPSGIFGYVDGYKEGIGHPFSKWQAQRWLAMAGGSNALPPITLSLPDIPSNHALGDYLSRTWGNVLGIDIHVEYIQSWGDYLNGIRNGEYQMFFLGWGMDYNDAYNFLHDAMANRTAFGNWRNDRYEDLLAQSSLVAGPDERKPLLKQAEEILVETDTVMAPLYNYNQAILTKPYLQRAYSLETNFADWTLMQAEAVIPTLGGRLTSYDGHIVIDIPAGVFTSTVHLVQGPATAMPAPAGWVHTGQTFELSATTEGSNTPIQLLPGKRYTITVTYPDAIPALEDSLALYYWDGSEWVQEPTSSVEPATNTLTAEPSHFSIWTVMGRARAIYLPTLLRR